MFGENFTNLDRNKALFRAFVKANVCVFRAFNATLHPTFLI